MTQVQLPAHLANRQVRSLTERAAEGMGSTLPPHISIQGNSFTFIDAAGNEYQPVLTFEATVVDVSDVMCKQYFDKPYDPGQSTYEPPACWSANGIAPSREAIKPQAALCAECPKNERGSAISKMSGAAIKACRDERWIALLLPLMPSMIFQLRITPGSFTNWKAYTETFRNYGVELSLGLTRFSFQPKTNGVLLFEHVGWVDEATIGAVEASVREKKTDAIVGRTDQPRVATLAAPTQQATLPPPNQFPQEEVLPPQLAGNQGAPTQLFQPAAPLSAPNVMPQAQQTLVATSAVQVPLAEQPAPRRRRRTAAEIAADAQPAAPAMGGMGTVPGGPVPQQHQLPGFQAAPQVPFPVAGNTGTAPPHGQANSGGQPQFGMAPGAPVNAEMEAMLKSMGFTRQPAAA